jgi:response regulator of citrate/malate metabolism
MAESNLRKRSLNRDTSFSDYDERKDGNNSTSILDQTEIEDLSSTQQKPKEPITLKKVLIRSATACFLAILYMSIVNAGHFYCILAVALTQVRSSFYRYLRLILFD